MTPLRQVIVKQGWIGFGERWVRFFLYGVIVVEN